MAKGSRICCAPGALARCKALLGCDNAHGDVLRQGQSIKANRTKDHRAPQAPLPPQCRPRDLQTLTKSSLRATRYAHGQSESAICAAPSGLGQSQSGVRAARSGHGQSRSPVRVARTAHGRSGSGVRAAHSGLGESKSSVRAARSAHGPSEAAVRTAQSAARADRSPVCRWQSPHQAATGRCAHQGRACARTRCFDTS